MRATVPASFCVLLLCSCSQFSNDTKEPVGVCELISHLHELHGEMVIVRGTAKGGRRHGLYLFDSDASDCTAPTGNARTSALALVRAHTFLAQEEGDVSFDTDASLEALVRIMEQTSASGIAVTIEGEMRSQSPVGYGHTNCCTGMLIVKSVHSTQVPLP